MARFEQVVLDQNEYELDRTEGNVWVKRPGKFRWDYLPPNEQQIVGDGDHIWVYDVELEQVTIQSQQAILGRTPAAILSGGEDLQNNFEIKEIGNQGRYDWVNLIPKDDESSFTEIRIGFEANRLRLMELIDTLDQRTRIVFVDLQENANIDDSKFNFVVPDGIDVIDGS